MGEAMDDDDAGEAELGAQKARMDRIRVALVHSEEFPGYSLPICPFNWRVAVLAGQEAQFVGEVEVVLRR